MTSASNAPIIYSIGHSDHELETFIALLRRHEVTTLVDVRSQPYSRWVLQANRETLARALQEAGLTYLFMGDVLGGRPADPSLYASGQRESRPDYVRVAATTTFQAAIDGLLELARADVVAMMCSEGDHRRCHRTKLITPNLLMRPRSRREALGLTLSWLPYTGLSYLISIGRVGDAILAAKLPILPMAGLGLALALYVQQEDGSFDNSPWLSLPVGQSVLHE